MASGAEPLAEVARAVAAAAAIDLAATTADAKALAWAAWGADGHRSPDVEQALIRSLSTRARLAVPVERRCAIERVLDLLIRWRAKLPADLLEALVDEPHCTIHATILACADPDVGAAGLRRLLARGTSDAAWAAACNVLAAAKDPTLAAHLLRPLTIRLSVSVTDPGRIGGRRLTTSRSCGAEPNTVPAGFPPEVIYRLSLEPRVRDQVVATGPLTVYARRTEYLEVSHGCVIFDKPIDREAYSASYLQMLLSGVSGAPPLLETHPRAAITWSNADAFAAETAAARERSDQAWRELVDALAANGLLTPADHAALVPNIVVSVRDERQDRSLPLPLVEGQLTPVEY